MSSLYKLCHVVVLSKHNWLILLLYAFYTVLSAWVDLKSPSHFLSNFDARKSTETLEKNRNTTSVQFSRSVVSDSLWPRCLCSPWNSPGQNTGVAFPFSRGSSQPRDWTQVSPLQADSLPTELWGKPILWAY